MRYRFTKIIVANSKALIGQPNNTTHLGDMQGITDPLPPGIDWNEETKNEKEKCQWRRI